MGYLSNFIVYFLAMIGLIILALYIYQKFSLTSVGSRKGNLLKVEESLSLSPRKVLYVIRSGNERFLVASDAERTTLISKLEEQTSEETYHTENNINPARRYVKADLSESNILAQDNVAPLKKPIMREIRKKLKF